MMGTIKGLKVGRRVVSDCMKNIHPIYNIKMLMIKKELMENPELKTENWDRFLPQFKKKNVKRRKAPTITKKEDNPFPPPQQPRKVDLELESGEYFLNQQAKQAKQREERTVANQEKKAAKRKQRAAEFVPPTQQLPAAAPAKTEDDQALEKLKEKFKKQKTDREKQSNAAKADLSSFLIKK